MRSGWIRSLTSMTINSTASTLLALYVLVAKSQGADLKKLSAPSRTTSSRNTSREAPTSIRRVPR